MGRIKTRLGGSRGRDYLINTLYNTNSIPYITPTELKLATYPINSEYIVKSE